MVARRARSLVTLGGCCGCGWIATRGRPSEQHRELVARQVVDNAVLHVTHRQACRLGDLCFADNWGTGPQYCAAPNTACSHYADNPDCGKTLMCDVIYSCSPGFICNHKGTCDADTRAAVGETCQSDGDCRTGLTCAAGQCAAQFCSQL